MANYLYGDLYDGKTEYPSSYVFVSDIDVNIENIFYSMVITAYSDVSQTTKVWSRSDLLLKYLSDTETEEERELRALTQFQGTLGLLLTLQSGDTQDNVESEETLITT